MITFFLGSVFSTKTRLPKYFSENDEKLSFFFLPQIIITSAEPSRSRMFVNTASGSPWKTSCWWVRINHGEKKKKGWWCGACGIPYDWRKPHRLLTLQIGDPANDQIGM